jgi:hypothetical protein
MLKESSNTSKSIQWTSLGLRKVAGLGKTMNNLSKLKKFLSYWNAKMFFN